MNGIVVTHGTATLEETAYLMDLTVATDKPIVITGAQRNFDEPDADGPRNILCAVMVASSPDAHGRGVLVAVGGEIHAAVDVTQAHTESLACFAGRDSGPVGMVSKHAVTFFGVPGRRMHLEVDRIEENVQLVRMPQGGNDLLLRACIRERVPGIVVEASAGGNVTVPFYEASCDALEAGIPVVVATRVAWVPRTSEKAIEARSRASRRKAPYPPGYLSGLKARILLMVALGATRERAELRRHLRACRRHRVTLALPCCARAISMSPPALEMRAELEHPH